MGRFAAGISKYMSVKALAFRLAKWCGTTTNRIFINDDIANANNGYIVLDSIIVSYIQRIKAEQEGIKEQLADVKTGGINGG